MLNAFPKNGPRVIFAKRIGTGYAPMSVRDGKVVVFHRASKFIKAVPTDTVAGMLAYINGELAALGAKERVTKDTLRVRRNSLVMPADVAKRFDREIIDCLDAKTGKIIWRKSYTTTYEDPYGFNNPAYDWKQDTRFAIAVAGFYMGRPEWLDLAIIYALVNFVGTIAVAKYYRFGNLASDEPGADG